MDKSKDRAKDKAMDIAEDRAGRKGRENRCQVHAVLCYANASANLMLHCDVLC